MILPFQFVSPDQGRLLFKGEASYWLRTYVIYQPDDNNLDGHFVAELATDVPISDFDAQLVFSQGCPLRSGDLPIGFLGPYSETEYLQYSEKLRVPVVV